MQPLLLSYLLISAQQQIVTNEVAPLHELEDKAVDEEDTRTTDVEDVIFPSTIQLNKPTHSDQLVKSATNLGMWLSNADIGSITLTNLNLQGIFLQIILHQALSQTMIGTLILWRHITLQMNCPT